jgi:hypothetical protein
MAQEGFRESDEHDRDLVNVTCLIEHVALVIALDGDLPRGAALAGFTEVAFGRVGFQRASSRGAHANGTRVIDRSRRHAFSG